MINEKQFGVWMDTHHATIVGNKDAETGALMVIAHVKGEEVSPSSSSKNENNQKKCCRQNSLKK